MFALPQTHSEEEWRLGLYPDGRAFAFTLVHDADSAYSRRLAPLFGAFDRFGFRITVTVFTFWAAWAGNGKIWSKWRAPGDKDLEFFAPKAVPLTERTEREFYQGLAAIGHEIGMHSPSETSDTREDLIRAFEYFKEIFGRYPTVYVEHSSNSNKEAQCNEGSRPGSVYYNTDLLNRYGSWVWVDGEGGLADQRHDQFYDAIAANGSPFNRFAAERYGVRKAFTRTGKWKQATGDGFLDWYSEENIDALEKHEGMALVYTHLDEKWLDRETRAIRGDIEDRLRYMASKDGWFAPAGAILDRTQAVCGLKIDHHRESLTIANAGDEKVDGLTVVSKRGRSLREGNQTWKPGRGGKIVLGAILPRETLSFTIVD
jgi:hypothetical protein